MKESLTDCVYRFPTLGQQRVLQAVPWLGNGKTTAEIAKRLNDSGTTTDKFRRRVYSQLVLLLQENYIETIIKRPRPTYRLTFKGRRISEILCEAHRLNKEFNTIKTSSNKESSPYVQS